jgi:cation:H+ antiporter
LLVGTIPIVFAITTTSTTGLPLESDQRFELLPTAAHSLFAVALLLDRSLSVWGACGLLRLFGIQFFASILVSADANRLVIEVLSGVYLVLAAAETFRRRSVAWQTVKDGLFTSFKKLEKQADAAEEAASPEVS